MILSDAQAMYVGDTEVSALYLGGVEVWSSGGDGFLCGAVSTQIDAGAVSTNSFEVCIPSFPEVNVLTNLISETPVSETVDLTFPAVPTVTPNTLVEVPVEYDGNGADAEVNVAPGGTASASSYYGGSPANIYNDLITDYCWQSGSTNLWSACDLGAGNESIVDKIKFYFGNSSYCPRDIIFQGYDEVGAVWDDLLSTTLVKINGWQEFSVPNSTAYQKYRVFQLNGYYLHITWLYAIQLVFGGVPDLAYYESGATVTVLSEGTLAKTGSTFVNWNTAADGTGTSYNPGDTFTITAPTTLYAQWTAV